MSGTQIADYTLTSLQSFNAAFKGKISTSQGHDAAKYEACYSHLHGSPDAFPASALLSLLF